MVDQPGQNSRKVVYIEDDVNMIELVKLILTSKGFEVLGAKDGPEGLELIPAEKPDLVLLDLMMPGMDGWEVFQRMRADEEMRTIPVIVVTARVQPIDITLGTKIAKVDDYITKPFTATELEERVRKVLAGRKRT